MLFTLSLLFVTIVLADFQPCPLLGPHFPIPTDLAQSPAVGKGLTELKSVFDLAAVTGELVENAISPNTTSFSAVLFDASDDAAVEPFFFQYNWTAPSLIAKQGGGYMNVDTIYRIGGLTEMFTVWTFLAEVGDCHWDDPVTQWVPELASISQQQDAIANPIDFVNWGDVTLGDLAGHLSGIERMLSEEYLGSALSVGGVPSCGDISPCSREDFFTFFAVQPPVYAPGTTPVKSEAGYQILAYALEAIAGRPFEALLNDKIIHPLGLNHTSLSYPGGQFSLPGPANDTTSLRNLDLGSGSPATGMYSSGSDLAKAGKAILQSSIITSLQTRRWLKPVSLTSNVVNSVGRPWEIYAGVSAINQTVTDVYTARGNFGLFSSYFGLVPNYNVGYAILATDTERNPDLNAYADAFTSVLEYLEVNAQDEAERVYGGVYGSGSNKININTTDPRVPGMGVDALNYGGIDYKAKYANILGIKTEALSIRLYPSNLKTKTPGGERVAFRAIYQDMDATADAGTPTCETWRDIDINGTQPLTLFTFNVDATSKATKLEIPSLNASLSRA